MYALAHWIPFFIYFSAGSVLVTHDHLWEKLPNFSQHIMIATSSICLTTIDWLYLTPSIFNFSSANKFLFYFHGVPFNIIPLQGLGQEFFLNIVMTLPLGVYLHLINHQMSFGRAILYGFFFSLLIECNQFVYDLLFHIGGVVDVDDLINNTIGTTTGSTVMIILDQTIFHQVIKQFMLVGGKSDKLDN